MIFLKELTPNDGSDVYDMLQGIAKDDNGFMNDVKDMPYDTYTQWLKRHDEIAKGITLPEWMVPQTTFWLYCDSAPVGIGRVRHYVNEALKENGGHIGYAIASPYRGKGYGNEILRLLLIECKNMGIDEVLIDAYNHNEPSNKVICRNGGRLVRETDVKNYYIIENSD